MIDGQMRVRRVGKVTSNDARSIYEGFIKQGPVELLQSLADASKCGCALVCGRTGQSGRSRSLMVNIIPWSRPSLQNMILLGRDDGCGGLACPPRVAPIFPRGDPESSRTLVHSLSVVAKNKNRAGQKPAGGGV